MKKEIGNNSTIFFRDSNVELLRIVLMFFIVIHHLIVHGSFLFNITDVSLNFATYQKIFYEAFVLFPVDCFVFISGYYSINLKFKKFFLLWFQCIFYSISISILSIFLTRDIYYDFIIKSFIPISSNIWWFVSGYFFLMLLSPGINELSNNIKKEKFEYLLVVGFIMNCCISFTMKDNVLGGNGSNLTNFIFIYFIGRYLNRYSFNISKRNSLFFYFASCALTILITFLFVRYISVKYIWYFYKFNNPLIIFESICVFFFFKKIKIKNYQINKIGSAVFAVYLINDNPFIRSWIYNNIFIINYFSNRVSYVLFLIFFALIIFSISITIEMIRIIISNPIINYICNTSLFKSIEIKFDLINKND